MITFVLYGLSVILNEPIPGSVYWLTGLVDGLAFLPLFTLVVVPMTARVLREKMGRLHYLQSVFPVDAVVQILTPWGYEFAPVLDDRPDDYPHGYALLADGTKVELDEDQTWYRLGNRRFGVTFLPDRRVLDDVHVDRDDIDVEVLAVEDDDGEKQYAHAVYGDKGVLKKERAGFRGYTPFVGDRADPDGLIVSLSRAINSLRGGGGVRLSEFTERMTRMEHGGGSQMSNKARAVAFLGTIMIGSVIGVVVLGVL